MKDCIAEVGRQGLRSLELEVPGRVQGCAASGGLLGGTSPTNGGLGTELSEAERVSAM